MIQSAGVSIASNTLHFPAFPQGEAQSNPAKVLFHFLPPR